MTKLESSLLKEILKGLAWQQKKEPETYLEFHTNYGRILKEGVHYDFANKEKIAELVMFWSMKSDKFITLDEYMSQAVEQSTVDSQTEDGKTIYYLPGTSLAELKQSPYVEQFVENDVDVLLMTDPIDEYVVNALQEYKGWKFKSASDADVELGDKKELEEKKKEADKKSREAKNFLAYVQSTIGKDHLEKVSLTHKLRDAVAVVSTKDGQASAQMAKIMKAMGNPVPKTPKTLELNTSHPLVDKMLALYDSEPKSEKLKNMVRYVYEQALMLEGGEIEDLTAFVKRVNGLIG